MWDACMLAYCRSENADSNLFIAMNSCTLMSELCDSEKYHNLCLAAKMWWISRTSQRTARCLFQSRECMTVAKLRGNLKGRSHPIKDTGWVCFQVFLPLIHFIQQIWVSLFQSFLAIVLFALKKKAVETQTPCYGFVVLISRRFFKLYLEVLTDL